MAAVITVGCAASRPPRSTVSEHRPDRRRVELQPGSHRVEERGRCRLGEESQDVRERGRHPDASLFAWASKSATRRLLQPSGTMPEGRGSCPRPPSNAAAWARPGGVVRNRTGGSHAPLPASDRRRRVLDEDLSRDHLRSCGPPPLQQVDVEEVVEHCPAVLGRNKVPRPSGTPERGDPPGLMERSRSSAEKLRRARPAARSAFRNWRPAFSNASRPAVRSGRGRCTTDRRAMSPPPSGRTTW